MEKEGQKPPRAPEPAPAERDDVRLAVNRCPFCHDDVQASDAAALVCRACLARHHAPCWTEGGRCGACGAVERLGAVDARPARQNFVLRVVLLLVFALLVIPGLQMSAAKLRSPPPAPAPARLEGARELSLAGLSPRDADSILTMVPELAGVDRIEGVQVLPDRARGVVSVKAPPANQERVARMFALVARLGLHEGRSYVAQFCRVWVMRLGSNRTPDQGRAMATLVRERLNGVVDAEYEPESHSLVLFGASPDVDWAMRELEAAGPR